MRRILIACALAYVPACAKSRQAQTDAPTKLEATDSVAVAVVRAMMAQRGPDSSRMNVTLSSEDQSRLDALRLKVPRVLTNFCEGEGCDFGYSLVACTTLTLRSADDGSAVEVGQVDAGDTVVVETGNLHIHAPGLAVVRRAHADIDLTEPADKNMPTYDTVRFAPGDTVILWEYHGEGYRAVEHKGRQWIVDEFWGGPGAHTRHRYEERLPAMSFAAPEIVQWLRLRPRNGTPGWWPERGRFPTARLDWGERCGPPQN
jgi:hypothetical protein